MRISEAAHLRRLASDMLLVAIRDLKSPKTTLDSAVFLLSPEFLFYAELVNMPFADPLKALHVLNAKQARELLSQIDSMRVGEPFDLTQVRRMKHEVAPVLKGIISKNKKATRASAVYTRPRGRAVRSF